MVQRTVLKVDISCQKCKKKLLKAVTGLEGVDKVEVDAAKGTLTVTGNADPYEVMVRTKKINKFIEVVTIGEPPAPQKPKADSGQKKPDDKKAQIHIHQSCPICQKMFIGIRPWDEPNTSCSIL